MNTMNSVNVKYKIQLDGSSKKFTCPACNQRTFVKMKDFETGEYLPDHVGRCDRENNCGYHFTLKQYLSEISLGFQAPAGYKKREVIIEKKIEFLPYDYVEKSLIGFDETNFAAFLISLFGYPVATAALKKYKVGRSKNDNSKASIFWRIDKSGNVRTGKIMCYDPNTGKRNKEVNPTWVHAKLENFNYHEFQLCFFGEHLLNDNSEKTIGIVESEKTAIIASIFMPELVWIATGAASGCKWREYAVYKVLANRSVIFFPDFGYYNKKTSKTNFAEWSERAANIRKKINSQIKVSRVLEDNISDEERVNDFDLADMLIKRNGEKGMALTDEEYPIIWDLKPCLT